MLGPSPTEIMALASRGPIVIFNVNDRRSDAFLVTTTEIRLLTLPELTYKAVEEMSREAREAMRNCELEDVHEVQKCNDQSVRDGCGMSQLARYWRS